MTQTEFQVIYPKALVVKSGEQNPLFATTCEPIEIEVLDEGGGLFVELSQDSYTGQVKFRLDEQEVDIVFKTIKALFLNMKNTD
jgi:hypothetical protein